MLTATRSVLLTVVALAALLIFAPFASTVAQELPPPQPIELECATDASEQLLGATLIDDGSHTLVQGRLILDQDGSIGAHRNLATTTVVVESGAFGFTLLEDAEMVITRAATDDTEASEEPIVVGEQVTLNPGDSYVPPIGAAHAATNLSDGETSVLFAAVLETGQPLEECVDTATPAA